MNKLFFLISFFIALTGNLFATEPNAQTQTHAEFKKTTISLLAADATTNQDTYLQLYDTIKAWTFFTLKKPVNLENIQHYGQSLNTVFSAFKAIQPNTTLQTMSEHQMLALTIHVNSAIKASQNN
jgi:hypothetical protein